MRVELSICRKRVFRTRKSAKQATKTMPGENLHAYRCNGCAGFHLGHMPAEVKRGEVAAADFTAWKAQRAPHRRRGTPNKVRAHLEALSLDGAVATIGSSLAAEVAAYRLRELRGPTWREAFDCLPAAQRLMLRPDHQQWNGTEENWDAHTRRALFELLRRRGWISFDGRERSLATGPRFHGT